MRKLNIILTAVFTGSFLLTGCSDSGSNNSSINILSSSELVKFDNHLFAGSGNCATCHSKLVSDKGEDVSIDKDWRSTMMANSAKDPLWQAKVHSEILRTPSISDAVQQKCSRCHMPMANVEANHEQDIVEIFDNGFLNVNNKYHTMAMDGVSCTVCHQIEDGTYLGTKESFTGGFKIDLVTAKPDRKIYGPYQNPFQRPMIMNENARYTPVYGSQIEKSELCATCHTLYTNPYDENGNAVLDSNNNKIEFPEQTPYLEWKHSIYGDGQGSDDKSCQTCHMPEVQGSVKISNRPQNMITARPNFTKHYFVGGNVFMLKVLKNNIPTLGLTANTEHFNATILRTQDMLKNSAKIQIGNVQNNGGTLEIPVTIINETGHKLPSGYPSRRVWLHLVVKDSNGNIIFESGKATKDGKIIGNDADENELTYELHYNVITSQDQVQIYEPVMKGYSGNVTYTLMRASEYIKDNRLLPKGFDKTTASKDIAVVGNAYNDNDFIGGQDTIIYKVDTGTSRGPYTVLVELKYQSVSYRFFQDLLKNKGNSQYVSLFERLYLQEDNSGYIIDSTLLTVN